MGDKLIINFKKYILCENISHVFFSDSFLYEINEIMYCVAKFWF